MRSLLPNGCAGMKAIAWPQVNAPAHYVAKHFTYRFVNNMRAA
jgi:hypothetical protein